MSATSRELVTADSRPSAAEQAFDILRQRLWAQGQLESEADAGQTILIASPARGAGVSTLTEGLADSCERGADRATLAITDIGSELPIQGELGEDGIVRKGPSYADRLDRYQLLKTPNDAGAARETLARLRLRYQYVFVDGGSIHETAFLSLAPLVDRRLLILDLRYLRRSELSNLRRDIDRMPVKFDGFIGNRHVDALPRTLGRLTS